VPKKGPLSSRGDFNDWQGKASAVLEHELRLTEVFQHKEGRHARSYPARLPVLTLDRIYVRDLEVEGVERHVGGPWTRLSDHVALAARLIP
jgi:endonuclease/exonuclease/phosphatase family metal-dependent hydrolase